MIMYFRATRIITAVLLSSAWGGYVWMHSGSWRAGLAMGVVLTILFSLAIVLDAHKKEPQIRQKSKNFDWGMHYFRGFAIVCIILTHLTASFGRVKLCNAFLSGGTILFLFISGYLCQYLDMKKPTNAFEYYRKKIVNVISPYVVCSIFTVLLVRLCGAARPSMFNPFNASWMDFVKMFAFGRAQTTYWYIPFVSILFLVSPLLLKTSNKQLVAISIISAIMAILFPCRGYPFLISIPTFPNLFTYFTFSYVFGFIYARFRSNIDEMIKRLFPFFILVVLSVGLWRLHPGFCHLEMVHSDLASNVQKLSLVCIALIVFSLIKGKHVKILDDLATYSFTLFFIHRLFFADFGIVRSLVFRVFTPGVAASFLIDIALYLIYIYALLVISKIHKMVIGVSSRSIIGS